MRLSRPSKTPWLSRKTVHRALFLALVSLFIALFDPLGLDQAADRRSAEAIDRVRALYYADETPLGRDRLTTVSIDENALRDVGRDWPPQYGFYAEALENIAGPDAPPRVVFLDYTFLTDLYGSAERDQLVDAIGTITRAEIWAGRPDCLTNPLAKIGCIKKAGGIPVIIGKPYPLDRCEPTPTLLMLDRVAVLSPVGWPGLVDGWKPVLLKKDYGPSTGCKAVDGLRGVDGHLVAVNTGRGQQTYAGVAQFDLAPAAAMLAAYCMPSAPEDSGPEIAACRPFRAAGGTELPAVWRTGEPTKILWGSRPDPRWLDREKADYGAEADQQRVATCGKERRTVWRTIVVAFAQIFAPLSGEGASVQVPCPYQADFRYERLAENAKSYDPATARALREQFIAGRAVIIGSTLQYGGDWTTNITQGTIPGMALHAMMFDNLVEQSAQSRDPPDFFWNLDWGEVLEVFCTFFAVLFISGRAESLRANGASMAIQAACFVGLFFLSLVLVASLAWLMVGPWRWTSVNILGLWLILVVGVIDVFKDVIEHYGRWWRSALRRWLGALLRPSAPAEPAESMPPIEQDNAKSQEASP